MGNIIDSLAFANLTSTYDKNTTSYLKFITRYEHNASEIKKYDIPIRHYHIGDAAPTVLMCHGNAEDIGQYDMKELSHNMGSVNVCIFDYSGYGLHTCREASESNAQKDTIAVYKYLIHTQQIDPTKIIILGRSLGSAFACYLAYYAKMYGRKKNISHPQKLILVSPLYSAAGTYNINLWLPFDKFLNCDLAPKIDCKTLIMHGTEDTIVPYKSGQNLSKLFPNLYHFCSLRGYSHNNIFSAASYYKEIQEFISY